MIYMDKNISLMDGFIALIKRFGSNFVNIHRDGIKNWWAIFLFKYGLVKKSKIKLYNGKTFDIRNSRDYKNFFEEPSLYLASNYKIELKNNRLVVNINPDYPGYYNRKKILLAYDKIMLSDIIRQVRDIFYYKEYSFMNPNKKTVVDIGANIGDTAIFFNLRGANEVYAVEAMPKLYNLMIKNLKLNKIENVVPINAVATSKKQKFRLPKQGSWAGDIQEADKNYVNVTTITLEEIVNRYGINNALLKIDCEGCEYNLIINCKIEILRKFSEIVIEYHYGYKNLIKKLNLAGFNVKHTRPTKEINNDYANPIMYVGFIIAKRVDMYKNGL